MEFSSYDKDFHVKESFVPSRTMTDRNPLQIKSIRDDVKENLKTATLEKEKDFVKFTAARRVIEENANTTAKSTAKSTPNVLL